MPRLETGSPLTSMPSPPRASDVLFALLAVSLLAMTLAWRVPMMLWDHLDLVPMLDVWRHGRLLESGFLHIHGGHMHTAAYAVLLSTTVLSSGQPWLDCLVSWLLLLGYACIMRAFVRETLAEDTRTRAATACLVILLTWYPGHLANLQWGWQVAVFLCLAGAALTVHQLTRPTLAWKHDAVALVGATVACFSFATAIALLPMALLLLVLRHDIPRRRRLLMALPWLLASALVGAAYVGLAADHAAHAPLVVGHYLLNWLGAGVARFATDLAPGLAVAGLLLGAWLTRRHRRDRRSLPWLGLLVFAILSGILTALGRAGDYAAEQAFVTRYVSFSSLFWLGLCGLLGQSLRERPTRWLHAVFATLALFAGANALHMIHKAHKLGVRTQVIAQTIRANWPAVDDTLLGEIYFGQPVVARERLQQLKRWGYAPFDQAPPPSKAH